METVIHPPRTLMEVFKGLPEGTLVQLIEKELIMSPPPKENHQRILGKIFNALYNLVALDKLGEVRCAPYDVFLDSRNAFQPDIIFMATGSLHKIKEDGVYGAPDLIIEILSPGTAVYDKVKKKEVYERNAVKEYWIIDPADNSAEGFCLDEDKFIALEKADSQIQSKLLNKLITF